MKTRRAKIDPMITMINVVFLLIAFFMFGQFQKAAPISITLPSSVSLEEVPPLEIIYIDIQGKVYFQNYFGIEAIAMAAQNHTEMQIHADQNTPTHRVISAWKDIVDAGIVVTHIGVQE